MELEQRRKAKDLKAEKLQEAEQVKQLKYELDIERSNAMKKKLAQRENMNHMFAENERQRMNREMEKGRIKMEDIKTQEGYIKMLEKQEADRAHEFQVRENRAKQNMERMADTVVSSINKKYVQEEQAMASYIKQKEIENVLLEQRKKQKMMSKKQQMKKTLDQQIMERENRKRIDKDMMMEQAEMWRVDREKFER